MSVETRVVWDREYIQVVWVGESESGKTDRYEVKTKDLTVSLGQIKWYAPWRKYCFYPNVYTIFDSNCLTEIAEVCKTRTQMHKSK